MRPLRPWQRLQWRLTLACAGVTLGLTLLVELVLLGVGGVYLLRSEGLVVAVTAQALGRVGILAPALAAQPPDVEALARALSSELGRNGEAAPSPRGALEVQVNVGGPGAGTVAVFDAAGAPLLALAYSPRGVARARDFTPSSRESELLGRALAGVTAPELLGARRADGGVMLAVPVRGGDGRVLGALVGRLEPFSLPRQYVRAMLGVALSTGVPLALLGLAVGLVVGAFTARWLVTRLRPLTAAADAWARGELDAVAQVPGGDELAVLADHLNHMAAQLRTVVGLRQALAANEERNRLARDLHDTVKQQLFAAAMQLGAARAHLRRGPEQAEQTEACLAQVAELVGTSQRELAVLLQELRPPPGDGPWPRPLRQQVEAWATRTGIAAELDVADAPLPPALTGVLTRIVQEALANVERHSGAGRVRVRLEHAGPSRGLLVVEDDGRGLPAARPEGRGMGLDIMRERAEALPGGAFRLGPGAALPGLRIEVSFTTDTPAGS